MGELSQVVLPNGATISYEYDHFHRILRETRSHGTTIENRYDNRGRVICQYSATGLQQEMIPTAAFTYHDGKSVVTDGKGGTTTYKIFHKQIYSITDPMGCETLFSWFIDDKSWFDPLTESIVAWPHEGGASRSLKATKDKRGLTTSYLYDSRGNPTTITEEGEDAHTTTLYSYNAHNLCTHKRCADTMSSITYDTTHPHLIKKIEEYEGERPLSFHTYHYNTMGRVERENHSHAITLWRYDDRGFPLQKTQLTNTEDPAVVTHYLFNKQGQCVQESRPDAIENNSYDIMGNALHTQHLSPSGKLLSETYRGFNLNNAPIWEQSANLNKICYFDYTTSGRLKGMAQTLTPGSEVAYTLYTYDALDNPTERVDPLGHCTYREYDLLGRVTKETLGDSSTLYTYEAGGLIETCTSPSQGKHTYRYTAQGRLKEITYPDKTKKEYLYDTLGRPIQEQHMGIIWKITYDGTTTIHTHLESGNREIREYDGRGNLLAFTDLAGYKTTQSYDGLNRPTSLTMPSGETTTWHYHKDSVTCRLPSGETKIERYEGGRVVETQVLASDGALLEKITIHYDPKTDRQEEIHGEERTITHFNALGLPITIQRGEQLTTYRYDLLGNCIATTDGEGRTTTCQFDSLKRMTKKELPNGSTIEYRYDCDSNLTAALLPNGVLWSASYDTMGRKIGEELHSEGESSQQWRHLYEGGYLTQSKDPLNRTHTYRYDSFGRLIEASVEGWQRLYSYDPRGHLTLAEQINPSSWLASWFYPPIHTRIERSYDGDGRLVTESTLLHSEKISETHQTWTPSTRSLQINNHHQTFTYQNNNLTHLSANTTDLTYSYTQSGALKSQSSPYTHRIIDYNASSLPRHITTTCAATSIKESLEWTPSGKLSTYTAPQHKLSFTYTTQGYLQSAGTERYEFDFGDIGTGIRTAAPHIYLPEEKSLDPFDRVIKEIFDQKLLTTTYNKRGEVTSQNQTHYEWDPWGNLLSIASPTFTWRGEYDALDRRIHTSYHTQGGEQQHTLHLYDPQKKFQEIGIQIAGKQYWKLNGPQGCDALVDDYGNSAILLYNGLNHLLAILSHDTLIPNIQELTPYGPRGPPPLSPHDLLSYAQTLTYQRRGADPTGLLWMGARYYSPQTGRFLSPDPVGHPLCLDLYAYANGDPINYHDPNGCFASHVYNATLRPHNQHPICIEHNDLESKIYQLSSLPILFVNGISNTTGDFMQHLNYLNQYNISEKQINGVYNASIARGAGDIFKCVESSRGIPTKPVQLIMSLWDTLLEQNPDKKILTLYHSGAGNHVKAALLLSTEERQQQIIALGFNSSAIIPDEICCRSFNYMSSRDVITFFDVEGMIKHRDELQRVPAHPDAKWWDHDFESPTFKNLIGDHIKAHIKKYGGTQ